MNFAERCARREDIEILLLWGEGYDTAEIARELGTNEPWVCWRLGRLRRR